MKVQKSGVTVPLVTRQLKLIKLLLPIFKGEAVFANNSAIMIQDNGTITIGVGMDCAGQLKCAKSIEIGNDCVIAYNTMVMDSDWHALTDIVTGNL